MIETEQSEQTAVPLRDAAAQLGISSDALRMRLKRGRAKGFKRGGRLYVMLAEQPSGAVRSNDRTSEQLDTGTTWQTEHAQQTAAPRHTPRPKPGAARHHPSAADIAPESIPEQALPVVIEFQKVELNRLLRDNRRLNQRLDQMLDEIRHLREMQQREQVLRQQDQTLRQQVQITVERLTERLSLADRRDERAAAEALDSASASADQVDTAATLPADLAAPETTEFVPAQSLADPIGSETGGPEYPGAEDPSAGQSSAGPSSAGPAGADPSGADPASLGPPLSASPVSAVSESADSGSVAPEPTVPQPAVAKPAVPGSEMPDPATFGSEAGDPGVADSETREAEVIRSEPPKPEAPESEAPEPEARAPEGPPGSSRPTAQTYAYDEKDGAAPGLGEVPEGAEELADILKGLGEALKDLDPLPIPGDIAGERRAPTAAADRLSGGSVAAGPGPASRPGDGSQPQDGQATSAQVEEEGHLLEILGRMGPSPEDRRSAARIMRRLLRGGRSSPPGPSSGNPKR